MNSTEIFSLALGLKEPWFIKEVELLSPNKTGFGRLNIYIDFERGYSFKDDLGELSKAYDTHESKWQHLNFFEHECFIHARVPRVKNSAGKVTTIEVPWARSGSGFTMLFEAFSMLLIENEMPVNKAAKVLRVVPNRIWRVFDYWISKAISKDDLSEVIEIGVDETSIKKGHNYVTVVADLKARRTVFVTKGKDADTLQRFATTLEDKGGKVTNIKTISLDMSPAFINGSVTHFTEATLVFDKFHLVKLLNESMDNVRKTERKNNEQLKGHKYLFLRNYKDLKEKQKADLEHLTESYPKLGEAYKLKELFTDMWLIKDPEEAKGYLSFWCEIAMESGIFPFVKFVKTIKSHWSGIVSYFDNKVSNGVLESINSRIQLAKKRARGYRNLDNYINMIYFLTAKLKFDYPQYSL